MESDIQTKVCRKCKQEKDRSEFYKNKNKKDGLTNWCKECSAIYYTENKKAIAKKRAKYYAENREVIAKKGAKYYVENRKAIHKQKSKYRTERYNKDPLFRLQKLLSSSIRHSLTSVGSSKNGRPVHTLLDYTLQDLCDHLNQFVDKPCLMCQDTILTWENSHIDHIIPISTATNEDEILELNQLCNLQLLCAPCNVKKSDNLEFGNTVLPPFAELYIDRKKNEQE